MNGQNVSNLTVMGITYTHQSKIYNQIQMVDEHRHVRKYAGNTMEDRPNPDLDWRDWESIMVPVPSHEMGTSWKVAALGSLPYLYTWPASIVLHRDS